MIIRQTMLTPARASDGFSMIDVLVAIIVLATALLALAALQGALTRNTADARARSQIAAYADGAIDRMRSNGYDSIVGATLTPTNGGTPQQQAAYDAQGAAKVSNLKTTVTVATYKANSSGTFAVTASTVPNGTATYKQVKSTTTWVDAAGQSRQLAFDTIVSPLQTKNDNTLVVKTITPSTSQAPVVREYNPAGPGVIPIAVGSGNDTAATNPKPEILSLTGHSSAVVGTTYNVLTYQAPDSSNQTVIQKRVETQVIACGCKNGAGITSTANVFAQPFRPTYWDGTKYASPKATTAKTSTSGPDPSAATTQSEFCDVCCRDRNDSTADTVKFDPFTTDYNHYRYDSSNNLVVVPTSDTSDPYLNTCRLIRVDGIFSVATDLHNYFFGLLATTSVSVATSPVPDPAYVIKYGGSPTVSGFVTDYLTGSIAGLAAGTGPLGLATATSMYNTDGLDDPANIGITYNAATTDFRYTHARGLYIDHLEAPALTAINNAIADCPSSSTQAVCVLPLLPFTTINVTELADWTVTTAAAHGVIAVTNTGLTTTFGNPLAPLRGVVNAQATAQRDDTANAVATIGLSNSGVTGAQVRLPVDPDDQASLTDSQKFTVTTGTSGGNTIGSTVSLTGPLPQLAAGYPGAYPSMSWMVGATSDVCSPNHTGNGSNLQLTNYTCNPITATSPASISVTVQKYNQAFTASGPNPCWSGHNTTVQYCSNFRVDPASISLNGAIVTPTAITLSGTDGNQAEGSTITFPSSTLNTGATTNSVSIGFLLQGTTPTTPTCSGAPLNHTATYPACP